MESNCKVSMESNCKVSMEPNSKVSMEPNSKMIDTDNQIINSNTKLFKVYGDLLGILFTSPDCEEDQYYHAFSFDRDILEDMIEKHVSKEMKIYYSIKEIRVFQYIVGKDNEKNHKLFIPYDYYQYNDSYPMYGYNLISKAKDKVEQVILITYSNKESLRENGISHNQIKINTFYEESILNA